MGAGTVAPRIPAKSRVLTPLKRWARSAERSDPLAGRAAISPAAAMTWGFGAGGSIDGVTRDAPRAQTVGVLAFA
jgi:hypothetical protein